MNIQQINATRRTAPRTGTSDRVAPKLSSRLPLVLAAVVASVGVAESIVQRDWDVLSLFIAIVVLLAGLFLRTFVGRPTISLRRDLVVWLDERAVTAGEPLERVADRAVSAYRAGLSVEPNEDDRGS